MNQHKTVAVAMSGGVDSSMAAALLKEQGFQVFGIMLRLWSELGKEDSNRCCTPDSMGLARRVAAKLDIPFYVIDAKAAFRETVVEDFLDGYGRGDTPNPCLVCNRTIRWKLLLDHALAHGADLMATGHYARIRPAEHDRIQLLRAVDASKDQSYVLHVLNQAQLRHAMFPIGDYLKADVRRMAEAYSLPTASRHDSQDLCFLAGDDYRKFLMRNRPEMLRPGKILAADGQQVGEHSGLANYTIGQRKGLGINSAVPLYVIGKDVSSNSLIVGVQEERGLLELTAGHINWVLGEAVNEPFRAEVKTRYTARARSATVIPMNADEARVVFDEPLCDITRGQAAVFFDEERVVGGGLIQ